MVTPGRMQFICFIRTVRIVINKIKNTVRISCSGVDLTTISNIEFYIRQSYFFRYYTPTVVSASEMLVVVPFEDCCELRGGNAELQFAYTDADGNPKASKTVTVPVETLLKEDGYDPL